MGNRYTKIMEKIHVTPEMEARVLRNLSRVDLGAQAGPTKKKKKTLSFPKILSLAACLLILVAGALTLRSVLTRQPVDPPPLQVGAPVQYEDAKALCEAVGFDLLAPTQLPEGMQAETYTLLGNGIAEVSYSDGMDVLTYRMAVGTDDISGDYTEYPAVDVVSVSGQDVTMKGDVDGYYTATWTDGEYTFAVSSTRAMTQAEVEGIIVSLAPCGQAG